MQNKSSSISTEQFLDDIHGKDAQIYFNVNGITWKNKPQTYEEARPKLQGLNQAKKDIYFIVNRGGTKNSDINHIHTLFIDWDSGRDQNGNYYPLNIVNEKKSDFLNQFQQFPLKPTYIVSTRNGYQIYWLLEYSISSELFVEYQKKLISYFHSDPKIFNPARVMRLPGYYWVKPKSNYDPYFVDIIEYNNVVYNFDSFVSFFSFIDVVSEDSDNSKTVNVLSDDMIIEDKTYNNTRFNKIYSCVIVGPKTLEEPFKSKIEAIRYLRKQDIWDYLIHNNINILKHTLQNDKISLTCPFHCDREESAMIYYNENNCYLKCFSSNCNFGGGTVIDIVMQLDHLNYEDAVEKLIKYYQIQVDDNAWKDDIRDLLTRNIETLNQSNFKEKYPYLFSYLSRIRADLICKHTIAMEKMIESSVPNQAMFFCSLREFERRYRCRKDDHVNNQALWVDRYCLLGLMRKLSDAEIPSVFLENSIQEKKKREYRIQYYSIFEYTEALLQQANDIAKTLKEYNVTVKGISRDLVLGLWGQEAANRLYPQQINTGYSPGWENILTRVQDILTVEIEEKGYSTISGLLECLQETYDWKNITSKRLSKCLPVIIHNNHLKMIAATKDIKEKLNINAAGYPRIIVHDDIVARQDNAA